MHFDWLNSRSLYAQNPIAFTPKIQFSRKYKKILHSPQ